MARQKIDLTNENQSIIKVILWLAWPLFLEQVLSTLVSFVDTAMVGSLGAAATASVSITNSFVFLINGVVISLGIGITAYVARSVGAKDYEAARAYIRHALLLLLIIGLPIAAAPVILHKQIPLWMGAGEDFLEDAQSYLLITSSMRIFTMAMMVLGSVYRGRGDTKTPLKVNIIVNLVNVVGNYLLIHDPHTLSFSLFGADLSIPMWGAGLGVQGAALSTGFSWLLGGTALLVMLFTKEDPTKLSVRDSFRPDPQVIRRVVKLSVPAMLERLCMSLAGIVVAKSIATLGTTAVAANAVYNTAESLSYMPAFAFANACTTLVGQALGAKKISLAKRYAYTTVGTGLAVMFLTGIGLYLFANPLVRIINQDTEVVALAERCLKLVAFIQPVQVIAWTFAGGLRGAGDTRWPFYSTAVSTWLFRALGAILCIRVWGMGLYESVICMCFDFAFRSTVMFLRFRSGKWANVLRDKKTA
ncbi:MAG: MATE family efflux transporter [Clostridia bacterium]|nr:MATE family efflux transporter [Clostridia bacterium]